MNERSVLGLVPARAGSKGVPSKNTRLVAGRPLVAHTFAAAKASETLTHILVSTDSEAVARIATEWDIDVPFRRPAELADDNAAMLPVVIHALDWFRDSSGQDADVLVLLQPTAPLRLASDIDMAVRRLLESTADSVVSLVEVPKHHHPSWQFRMRDDGEILRLDGGRLGATAVRRQLLDSTYTRNGAVYAVRVEAIRRTGSLYGERCEGFVMPPERSVNVDTPLDLRLAEFLVAHRDDPESVGPSE